jgi:CubicO group peptidase (beta-lactamase class C family)
METSRIQANLQGTITKVVDSRKVFGISVSVEKGDGSLGFTGAAGNLKVESQYFIASTTKLYITAMVMKMRQLGKLSLEDNLSRYLESQLLENLMIIKGVDYAHAITIRQLLAHTSGLPDYFQQKRSGGKSLQDELTSGKDQRWSFEQVIEDVKKMKPAFKPGEPGKALYSDTNYQLLGRIIEVVIGERLSAILEEHIFDLLDLKQTYLYEDDQDTTPAVMYFKEKPLPIPLAMTSFGPDGGIVSTSGELMRFIKAFFKGELFPAENFVEMKCWNRIFFPLEYGVGLARFKLPRLFSPFKATPELLGHSGLSGAFAFYCPEKDIYLAGTVNQINQPDTSFRFMLQILNNL